MATFKHLIALAAAATIAAQPCLAADLVADDASRESGMRVGLYARVPLGDSGRVREEPRAGLSFGATHIYRGINAATGERRIEANLVDIGLFRSGRPSLMLSGRQMLDESGRLRLQDDEDGGGGIPTWALVAGGLVVAAGVGYLVLLEQFDCDEDEECS